MKHGIVCWDLETTGTNTSTDEILQFSFIDDKENILLQEMVKPLEHKTWPKEAIEVHHITPEKVANAKPLSYYADQIYDLLCNSEVVVGYNTISYDLPLMKSEFKRHKINREIYIPNHFDVINEFATQYSLYYGNFKEYKLGELLALFGWKQADAHNAAGDTIDTIRVYNRMMKDIKKDKAYLINVLSDGKEIFTDYCTEKYIKTHPGVTVVDKYYIANGQKKSISAVENKPEQYWTRHSFVNPRKLEEFASIKDELYDRAMKSECSYMTDLINQNGCA